MRLSNSVGRMLSVVFKRARTSSSTRSRALLQPSAHRRAVDAVERAYGVGREAVDDGHGENVSFTIRQTRQNFVQRQFE
jgi:hypothetical protein